ncbi:very long chain fatty acid elongase 7-like [Rhynchophorus ferrugineus]|uniref:very long chain fatty acid elongase 7-like n=1 Tax=Rhynchophorus ferrugineus TaxID=354439 RepID=UPI003FCCC8D3
MDFNETDSLLQWDYIFTEIADTRSSPLFLMKDPIIPITIVAAYLTFVLHFGPKYMKSRQPYQFKSAIILYNAAQIIINSLLLSRFIYHWKSYNWICQPFDSSTSNSAMMMVYSCHLYFLNKIMDLTDTLFFVLRKKQEQVTFLHVWHHSIMVILSWVGTKYSPNGHSTLGCMINSFIHILLYLYYLLAAMGPAVQKYLWWKKYLTALQLVQFGLIMIHQLLIFAPSCNYPSWTSFCIIPNAIVFTILFSNFYAQKYKTKDKIA